jgi:DNA-binding NtrC family response regulator
VSALVVDDQRTARVILRDILQDEGVTVLEAETADQARRIWTENAVTLAFVDIRLSQDSRDRSGLELVRELRETSGASIVVVSGLRETQEVRAAFRLGADDYLLKDEIDEDTVRSILARSRERAQLEAEVHALRARVSTRTRYVSSIVGTSIPIEALRERIRRVATSDRPVLVRGPSGSGKELVVREIHALGPTPDAPLYDVNCAALPETLVESYLFGHERGAFTGADRRMPGALGAVGNGTLFLDEIAELSAPMQAKLLRVLETKRYRSVGSTREQLFEGRIVAATHADLEGRVKLGRFREDLFHRLDVLVVRVPPLEARREDIPPLVAHFAKDAPRELRFTESALALLTSAEWPGHVRQLRNVVDRIAVLHEDDPVTEATVIAELGVGQPHPELPLLARAVITHGTSDRLELMERVLVEEALRMARGNHSEAARLLGVHRKRIARRVARPSDDPAGDE